MMMNETEQVALLEGLLAHYSPTWGEASAVDYLAEQMRGLGYTVHIDAEGSVIGTLGDGPREIILLGHIDTVTGNIPVRREENRLYGRGAVDAKGPLACFTAAAVEVGPLNGWKLTVIGAVGEEGDSRGAKLIAKRPAPDYCIIGEPSSWDRITLGYKGSAWLEYIVRKPIVHTAAQMESACEAAVKFWNEISEQKDIFNTDRQRVFDQLSMSLRKIHSESDGFYETAYLHFNLRLPPEVTIDQMLNLLTPCAGEGEIKVLDSMECYRVDKTSPLVRPFLAAIRKEGGKPGFVVKTGTSDMNTVGPVWNCPIVAFGPGDSNLDHTPEEHIMIDEYLLGVRVLVQALKQLGVE